MPSLAAEADRTPRIQGLSAGDVRAALQHSNPKAPASDLRTMAEIIAVISNVIAELPKAERRELAREKEQVRRIVIEAVGHGRAEAPARAHIEGGGKVERSRGTGLGERLSLVEGRARLASYVTPRPLESWAGPVAGAGEIEESLGIPRSTLCNWQQRGVVVGLLRGERKLAYPLEQFVDARPLEGIADVVRMAPDARSAWLWLRQPHAALDGKVPLAMLKDGERTAVVTVAERDFL